MRTLALPFLVSALALVATPAFAQPMDPNCQPSPDGAGTICELVEEISEADLANRRYIEKTTFASVPSGGWARDSVELEGAMSVSCVDGPDLLRLLRTERGGRSTYDRLRKDGDMEAFSVEYGLDEMPWDGDAHALREASPYVWLTIEPGRFDPDPDEGGARDLSVGTDIMDDVYYDTADFKLLDNEMSLRGRARWDTPTEIRRLLIAAKLGTTIDEFGLKRAAKIDVRRDGASADDIADLDEAVRSGFHGWTGGSAAIQPVREIYERLARAGKLPDVGTHEDVLLLEPKAYLRSTRSRFHLNEASLSAVRRLYDTAGAAHLSSVTAQIQAARAAGTIPPARVAEVEAFEKKVASILDGSAIAARAEEALKKIDPAMTVDAASVAPLMPGAGRPSGAADVAKRKAVADAVSAAYHDAAGDLADVRRAITNSEDQSLEDEVDRFVAFLKSEKPDQLGRITTMDRFEALHGEIAALPEPQRTARLDAYNAWAQARKNAGDRDFRRWEPLDADAFTRLGAQISNEKLRIWVRQLEAAGTAARGLWFDQARAFFVPSSSRSTGNLLIDTMDMTEMYSPGAWNSIPAGERTADKQLPVEKAFDAVLVNELQIELGLEKPYLDRMEVLKKQIQQDRASIFMRWARDANLGGANDEDAYRALLADLRKKPAAELASTVDALNAFARAQGSALDPFTATSLKAIPTVDLTHAVRDRAVRTDREVETALSGARFVFEQYRNQLKSLAALKGGEVLDTLRDAGGPACMEWKDIEASKGDRALEKLKQDAMRRPNG